MSNTRNFRTLLRGSACVAVLAGVMAPAASAKTFQFVYTGTFNTADSLTPQGAAPSNFTDPTPFIATALFDDSSPNLAAPVMVPGFVAYSPISATLIVGGQTFNVATYNQNPTQGITVAVFDDTTPFMPGHYATGFLQNPVADGAGFIGDWITSSPTFSATNLVPTVFTDYQGVGYGSGPDLHNGQPPAVVPIPLTDAFGKSYSLTLGNYDEQFADGSIQNTGRLELAPVPEAPSVASFGLMLALGLGGLTVARRKKVTSQA